MEGCGINGYADSQFHIISVMTDVCINSSKHLGLSERQSGLCTELKWDFL
jgi:hypothetical protein